MDSQEIEHGIEEYWTLHNKLTRYWKKLVKVGIEEARKQGKRIVDLDNFPVAFTEEDILIRKMGDERDTIDIVRLARQRLPSLCRRYEQKMTRYHTLREQLESIPI
jgi:hypothetical protein